MVLLRDGRTLIGFLRSVDQFANLVLHQTIERIHVGKEYGDIPRGVFIVRGENVVLLGEIVIIITPVQLEVHAEICFFSDNFGFWNTRHDLVNSYNGELRQYPLNIQNGSSC